MDTKAVAGNDIANIEDLGIRPQLFYPIFQRVPFIVLVFFIIFFLEKNAFVNRFH